jgi:hypothetical protein
VDRIAHVLKSLSLTIGGITIAIEPAGLAWCNWPRVRPIDEHRFAGSTRYGSPFPKGQPGVRSQQHEACRENLSSTTDMYSVCKSEHLAVSLHVSPASRHEAAVRAAYIGCQPAAKLYRQQQNCARGLFCS